MIQTYFQQNNWEPFAYRRLNQVIDKNKNNPESFVVFDFDNTSVIMDIEDNYMIYAIDNLLYHLNAEDFHQMLLSGPFNFDQPFQNGTIKDLADDIAEAYTYLYDHYIKLPESEKSNARLEEIRQTSEFQDFKAKYRAYYVTVGKLFKRQPGHDWVSYHFAGQTRDEYYQNCLAMFKVMEQQPFEVQEYTSASTGKVGEVTVRFESGLHFPQETRDLYQAFHNNGITVYIISASPVDLVYAASNHFNLNVDRDHAIAMEYPTKDGIIQPAVLADSFVTKGPGKTEAIQKGIMPRHNQAEPIAVFGDSTGDYNMMIDFDDLQLAVLFNVLSDDQTQEIVDQAIESYGDDDARYVLQGRNEQIGRLQASQGTLAIGATESTIKPQP
ncbi:haloacid dehalogenase-like hydrolase [Aerococcaceae bacterium DSM 111176]|nr:haloacid dehalogenase-like hydrolase [Aerococcaceae bacterium DSM 111176]